MISMKIVVLLGSPHRKGSSNLLAEQFIKGAEEAGHTVKTIDAAHMDVRPCLGCNACRKTGECVQKDEMKMIREELLEADLAAFVTPVYYLSMTAQLKTVIDRFYSFSEKLSEKKLKTVLITAAGSPDEHSMGLIRDLYKAICGYLQLEDCGMILGAGCPVPPVTTNSPHMREAYELGKSL